MRRIGGDDVPLSSSAGATYINSSDEGKRQYRGIPLGWRGLVETAQIQRACSRRGAPRRSPFNGRSL